jgi:hypothetical protein
LADSLETICCKVLKDISTIKVDNIVDLRYEVADMKAWANLGLYFSNKLRAAVEYKRFKASNNKKDLDNSIAGLTKATANWHSLVEVTSPVYQPVPLTHFCENEEESKEQKFHWSIVETQVKEELDWLKNLRNSNQ